jgi:hypothetical protein
MAMTPRLLPIVVALVASIAVAGAAEPDDARRAQAAALVKSGDLAGALALYDALTQAGSTDPTLYGEAIRTAQAAEDFRRNAVYRERQLKIDPDNFRVRQVIPILYRVAGDEANAGRSRGELIAFWKAATDPAIRAQPSFTIDRYEVGRWVVIVNECFEIAGTFGVGYQFNVLLAKSGAWTPADLRSVIVLEHDQLAGRLQHQADTPDTPIRPSLDVYEAGTHKTLQFFDADPAYPALREIVRHYVSANAALVDRGPVSGAAVTCATASRP